MRRVIFALLLVVATAKADEDCKHNWKPDKKVTKCCLSGEEEPNCTGKQTATYLVCTKCGTKQGHDSTACQ